MASTPALPLSSRLLLRSPGRSSLRVRREHVLRLLGGLALTLVLGVAHAGWRHFYPAQAEKDWAVDVFLDGIDKVSALAREGDGRLLLSQERNGGQGDLLRLAADGSLSRVQDGLSKPDGMIAFRGGVVFSQEQGDQPVRWRTAEGTRTLFSGRDVEGLASDDHYLYAIEDQHGDGKLLRFDPERDELEVLRGGLDEAEGVAACPDGRLFYVEKGKGWVRQLTADGNDPKVLTDLNQPGFLLCNADGLWVSEDATHMARLLLLDPAGTLHTVVSHLRSAQTLLETGPGHYLLAEQGRNRVLQLQRIPSGS